MSPDHQPVKKSEPGFANAVKSAASAAFGVQSQSNRERDFTTGKPAHFLAAGLLLTLVFIIGLGLLVKFVLATAT